MLQSHTFTLFNQVHSKQNEKESKIDQIYCAVAVSALHR